MTTCGSFLTGEAESFYKHRISDTSILYVEDNFQSRKLLSKFFFGRYGLKIHVVSTAREGMELLKTMAFEFVFVDIVLPDISGIDALKEFKSLNKNGYAKYIAISAEAYPDKIELALMSGFDKYVIKPIEFKFINEIIESTLSYS